MPSTKQDFVHLHVHTEYSMLDGAARVNPLVEKAVSLGQKALAVTDHGSFFGAYNFYKACVKNGIKPIIGIEAYLAPGVPRTDKTPVFFGVSNGTDLQERKNDVSGGGAYTHMTLLAKDNHGMHNLFKMASLAAIEGYYRHPRMDRELFQKYAKGVIGTTGCPSSEVQTKLRLGQYEKALECAADYQDILGKENYFVEVMDHAMKDNFERQTLQGLYKIAKALNAPIIATNDLHYVNPEDAVHHDHLLCLQTGNTIYSKDRFKFDGSGYYLKSAQEMYSVWKDNPEFCSNTLEVAQMCNVSFEEKLFKYMPPFSVPKGETVESHFHKETIKGLKKKYPDSKLTKEVLDRAKYEEEIITAKGYASYYLIVADFTNWARQNGIRVGPGRGSGAGSIIAYAMGITDLCPLVHGLIFERFLNPERNSPPDFDIDFEPSGRDKVVEYVTKKYGEDKVAHVVTFANIKSKNAIRDAARVLDYPISAGEQMVKAFPSDTRGVGMSLSSAYSKSIVKSGQEQKNERYSEAAPFRELVASSEDFGKIYDAALGIEGLKRQWGVHAAAILISSETIMDIVPVMRWEKRNGELLTQFEYVSCEEIGLVKMDFLGLQNLTTIQDTLKNIKTNKKISLEIETVPLDDKETFKMLSTGNTIGIFQLERPHLQDLLKRLKPDSFEDITALNALNRPGPMDANAHIDYIERKNGLQKVKPIHPELEKPLKNILRQTYGLIVYQEQVMEIARILAGYTMGQADTIRKVMGKKNPEILAKEYPKFESGMIKNGYSKNAVKVIWDIMEGFAAYAFNKSHSAAYSMVSYWTAYLKTHYPAEYMAALLTSNLSAKKTVIAPILADCKRMNITVLVPDVNESEQVCVAQGENIRLGLQSISNVGSSIVEDIIETRKKKGKFTDFHDFLRKVSAKSCNKRILESLIKAGAFDSLGHTRSSLIAIHASIGLLVSKQKREEDEEFKVPLFDILGAKDAINDLQEIPDLPEWNTRVLLDFERELLGLYISGHPLDPVKNQIKKYTKHKILDINDLNNVQDKDEVIFAGLISGLDRRTSKNGKRYAFFEVEDLDTSISVKLFGKDFENNTETIQDGLIAQINGTADVREDKDGNISVEVFGRNIIPLDLDYSSNEHFNPISTDNTNREQSNQTKEPIQEQEQSQYQLKEQLKEQIQESIQEPTQEQEQAQPQPNEQLKEPAQELIQEQPQEQSNQNQEQPQEQLKEQIQESIQEQEQSQYQSKEQLQDQPQETTKDQPQDQPQESPQEQLVLTVNKDFVNKENLENIKKVASSFNGITPLKVRLEVADNEFVAFMADYKVDNCTELTEKLSEFEFIEIS